MALRRASARRRVCAYVACRVPLVYSPSAFLKREPIQSQPYVSPHFNSTQAHELAVCVTSSLPYLSTPTLVGHFAGSMQTTQYVEALVEYNTCAHARCNENITHRSATMKN